MLENGLLIFDIKGPMAHFRKYYTNSSSLSYAFPPRTAAAGMIAAILGYERDSYYDIFERSRCGIGVSARTAIRHITQTVNYVRTKGLRELNGSFGPTQVPLDIIMPIKEHTSLVYRMYFCHEDKNIMDELKKLVWNGRTNYPIYMGISEFIAAADPVAYISGEDIEEVAPLSDVILATACNIDDVAKGGLEFEAEDGQALQYIKERMPVEFGPDRELKTFGSYIFEKNRQVIYARLKTPCYRISYNGIEEDITFM